MILIAARACIRCLRIDDVTLATNTLIHGWAGVGDLDHAVAQVAAAFRGIEVAAYSDDIAAVGVRMPTGAGAACLGVDGCYAGVVVERVV